ncbi:MAG: carboxy terminal-processing peptidase [Pirellulales bacterium]|nr:carboxy terminal-processing peptidase [Pirellulales bacterium]
MNSALPGISWLRRFRNLLLGTLLLAVLGAAMAAPFAWARPAAPDGHDRRIAILVSAWMDRHHLSEMHVNDEISQRTFEKFLDSLDPMKLFFYQSDVEEFSKEKLHIDDYVKQGDVRLAKRIFDRFLQRMQERIAVAQRYVDADHDFSLDEKMLRDPEKMAFATSAAEAEERWRKRVKFDMLRLIADDVPHDEAVERLHKRYRSMRRNWEQTDNDELLEVFLSALTMSFDPHSNYMSPSTLDNFTIQMRLELNGIGASLQSKYGETIVRRIVPGGAADKDGRLKIDDIITGVAQGSEGEFVDIVEMKINDVVQLIRGKPGTIVRLEIDPADKSGRKVLDITRARIELKDSEARSTVLERSFKNEDSNTANSADPSPTGQIVKQRNTTDGTTNKIGVISLPSFYMDMKGRRSRNPNFKSTSRDVHRLLEDFNRQGVDLVVMDLRFNGGGSLPESVATTGLFIDQGPVVQVKGADGRVLPYEDVEPGQVWSGPLVVVINKFSASASEIFAGAIQDYGRGIIVGDRSTHGKGTVQELKNLGERIAPRRPPNYGALKMTIQQFYLPGGDSTQSRGVVSDVELPYRTTYWEGIGEAELDFALEFDRVDPLDFESYQYVDAQLLEELKRRSDQRCHASEFFTKERRKIKRYLESLEESTVTLNKAKFLAQRAEVNSEKDQEEIFEEMQEEDRPVFPLAPKNPIAPYNNEVLAIALDYLELLNQNRVAATASQQ